MRLLLPFGLLALTGLIVLLVIYLIKPSYQSKLVPSTYIWRESLKYRKRQRKDSIFRNLLIILCQVLIIVLASLILSMPFVRTASAGDLDENILIIDGSASMRAASEGSTRFERAVSEALGFAEQSIDDEVPVSIILAGEEAAYVVTGESSFDAVEEALSALECSYAAGDIAGAMELAAALQEDKTAEVRFYTGTQYRETGGVSVVDVSSEDDWNACVLDVRAELTDNYYTFYADVAVYGSEKYLDVSLTVNGANGGEESVEASGRVNCADGEIATVTFSGLGVFRYEDAEVAIRTDDGSVDSLDCDNAFHLYGGTKETIRIQYASSLQNNFFTGALLVLQSAYADSWEIEIFLPSDEDEIATSGYDLYIFEHAMPSSLPTDGAVLLVDPDRVPSGLDVSLGGSLRGNYTLTGGAVHPVTEHIDASDITATQYRPITSAEGFQTLMYCEGDSVFAVRNDDEMKAAILTLDLNRSNLPLLLEFPTLVSNLFNYFIPETLEGSVFDVGEEFTVNARGTDVALSGAGGERALDTPAAVTLHEPGSYTVTQVLASGRREASELYIKISDRESNVVRIEEELAGAERIVKPEDVESDIYLWLALALMAVLFLERFLESREKV